MDVSIQFDWNEELKAQLTSWAQKQLGEEWDIDGMVSHIEELNNNGKTVQDLYLELVEIAEGDEASARYDLFRIANI